MKFRKKPIVIDAHQWHKNGDHPLDDVVPIQVGQSIFDSEGRIVRYFRHPQVDGDKPCEHCGNIMFVHGWIDTLEGGHIVCPGDWIITGIAGEHYPCKPAIFESTYEPMPDESPKRHGGVGEGDEGLPYV